jgi:hypothetical protein
VKDDVRALSNALLYEGYLLYPYRGTALKNRYRALPGTLYPESFCRALDQADRSALTLECVAVGTAASRLTITLRFLQLGGVPLARDVHAVTATLAELQSPRVTEFQFAPLDGVVTAQVRERRPGVWAVRVDVGNHTAPDPGVAGDREVALARALVSPHLVLTITDGRFVSLIDPPDAVQDVVASCTNVGTWPVLTGTPEAGDMLLGAPIILYDYPKIAPESVGDFFDGTEIDELLTLRVLTLTDVEKREMAEDPHTRALLERTESHGLGSLPDLHGALRAFARRLPLVPGSAVRLHPAGRADILDLALEGKRATVLAVEHDFEGRAYVAVTIDDDPGKDLGAYGHRFFFRPEEVELL